MRGLYFTSDIQPLITVQSHRLPFFDGGSPHISHSATDWSKFCRVSRVVSCPFCLCSLLFGNGCSLLGVDAKLAVRGQKPALAVAKQKKTAGETLNHPPFLFSPPPFLKNGCLGCTHRTSPPTHPDFGHPAAHIHTHLSTIDASQKRHFQFWSGSLIRGCGVQSRSNTKRKALHIVAKA